MTVHLSSQDYWDTKIYNFKREVDIFMELGNTGAATHRHWSGLQSTLGAMENTSPADIQRAHLDALTKEGPNTMFDLVPLRHPDPMLVVKQEIKCPRLQVMGSWKKITNISKGVGPRQGFSSFVWKSTSQ